MDGLIEQRIIKSEDKVGTGIDGFNYASNNTHRSPPTFCILLDTLLYWNPLVSSDKLKFTNTTIDNSSNSSSMEGHSIRVRNSFTLF